jgi:hypothetical protein
MLRQRMDTDHDVRAPFFKQVSNKTETSFMKKFTRLGPDLIHHPVEIFHPMLLVLQGPVIDLYQLVCDVMRLFDRFYDPDHGRVSVPKFLQAVRYRLGSRTVPAAGIGGNY